MGYILTIGEFKYEVDGERRFVFTGAETHETDDAPINSSESKTSCCSPSYSQWLNFSKLVGLEDVFFAGSRESEEVWWIDSNGEERDGLIRNHPGTAKLDEEHLKRFKRAKDDYIDRVDGACEEMVMRRLDWLIYWTEWALENCKYPTFANS